MSELAASTTTNPEARLGSPNTARRVCCEHWCGQGEDGWPECCMCQQNPCGTVTVMQALEHGDFRYWQGSYHGLYVARDALSEAIAEAAPDDPSDINKAFGACYTIVRGEIDEPPF